MTTGQSLLQLVQSLTTSEKRYFTLYTRQQGDGNHKQYIKLYNDLLAWPDEIFDEAAFRRKHRNKSYIRQFNTYKRDLLYVLMRSIRMYHEGSDPEMRVAG